jgi:membrane protease YdiL (CAAX protease family)
VSSSRVARALSALAAVVVAVLLAAPAALAADGVGIGGPADDKKTTYWGFGVMIFFVLVVVIGSLIQIRLEGRKERMRAELERVHRPVD